MERGLLSPYLASEDPFPLPGLRRDQEAPQSPHGPTPNFLPYFIPVPTLHLPPAFPSPGSGSRCPHLAGLPALGRNRLPVHFHILERQSQRE